MKSNDDGNIEGQHENGTTGEEISKEMQIDSQITLQNGAIEECTTGTEETSQDPPVRSTNDVPTEIDASVHEVTIMNGIEPSQTFGEYTDQNHSSDKLLPPVREDHEKYPIWVDPTGFIFLDLNATAADDDVRRFLLSIAEPAQGISFACNGGDAAPITESRKGAENNEGPRPFLFEAPAAASIYQHLPNHPVFRVTRTSAFAAGSVFDRNVGPRRSLADKILDRLSGYNKFQHLPDEVCQLVRSSLERCGLVRLVMRTGGRRFLEITHPPSGTLNADEVQGKKREFLLSTLLADTHVAEAANAAALTQIPKSEKTTAASPAVVPKSADTPSPTVSEASAASAKPKKGRGKKVAKADEGAEDTPPPPKKARKAAEPKPKKSARSSHWDIPIQNHSLKAAAPLTSTPPPEKPKELEFVAEIEGWQLLLLSRPAQSEADLGIHYALGNSTSGLVFIGRDESCGSTNAKPRFIVQGIEIHPSFAETIRERCVTYLHTTIPEEYEFTKTEEAIKPVAMDLTEGTRLHPYQHESLSRMFSNMGNLERDEATKNDSAVPPLARSGVIVLPCGAGKSLVGVAAASIIKKSCLVLCSNTESIDQWAREFKSFSTINEEQVVKFSAGVGAAKTAAGIRGWLNTYLKGSTNVFGRFDSGVLITTYPMLTNSGPRAEEAARYIKWIREREWGLMILDEVHCCPAEMFSTVLCGRPAGKGTGDTPTSDGRIRVHVKLGLTATLVREDDKIQMLEYSIGPKLYEADWSALTRQGFIARVECSEIQCGMPPSFREAHDAPIATSRLKQLLVHLNPSKLAVVQRLVAHHESQGDKILIYSDDIYALKYYAAVLDRDYICGETKAIERARILKDFSERSDKNTLIISRIGDQSLNLPEATCLIQISKLFGSRRQEAQRLGRILRARRAKEDSTFSSSFYTLISMGTDESRHHGNRKLFLEEQGYRYNTLTDAEILERHATTATTSTPSATHKRSIKREKMMEARRGVSEEELLRLIKEAARASVEKAAERAAKAGTKRKKGGEAVEEREEGSEEAEDEEWDRGGFEEENGVVIIG
ncbi:P-loop containing nucleoside triphosphate hydrolase protein [Cladochytrium replicatum]|nr:P-loop containing nucleoside triphosphate hydrolase protein [Cladochytrium replicatum]